MPQILPRFRKNNGAAASPRPALLPGEEDPSTSRRHRLMRLAAIILIALGSGQYVQSTNRAGQANAAVATSPSPDAGAQLRTYDLLQPVAFVSASVRPQHR